MRALQCRHNGHDGVSNHQPNDCLLNRYSGTDQRKHQSSASLALCGELTGTGEFTARRASNAEMFPFDGVIMNCMTMDVRFVFQHNGVVVASGCIGCFNLLVQ